jgi:hypothetical protein
VDLNHLLFQHQVAVIDAQAPRDRRAGSRYDLVRHYETRIARLRQKLGVAAYPEWFGQPVAPAAS